MAKTVLICGKLFDGADCILCKDPIWETATKNMK